MGFLYPYSLYLNEFFRNITLEKHKKAVPGMILR